MRSGRAKVELALARGKKVHDKRETMKERDWKREQQRLLRHVAEPRPRAAAHAWRRHVPTRETSSSKAAAEAVRRRIRQSDLWRITRRSVPRGSHRPVRRHIPDGARGCRSSAPRCSASRCAATSPIAAAMTFLSQSARRRPSSSVAALERRQPARLSRPISRTLRGPRARRMQRWPTGFTWLLSDRRSGAGHRPVP